MVCVCLRLSCPCGLLHYLGFGAVGLHSFDPPFLEARLNYQALGLGIPKGRLVLWFSEPTPHNPPPPDTEALCHPPPPPVVDHRGLFRMFPSPQWVRVLSTMC